MNDTIFDPRFDNTASVDASIDAVDQQRWLVEHLLLMPKHEAWIHRDISVSRVASTTAIEGEGIGTEAVNELSKRKVDGKQDTAEQANLNALRAYEFVDYLSTQSDIPIDELVVRTLNREFMKGLGEEITPGAYRRGQNKIPGYMPPNQGDVPPLMRAFAQWLVGESDIHPIIKAGLAHLQLVAIHPFWDGNGRTARAVMTLILQQSGHGFKNLLSIESVFAEQRDEYIAALEKTLGGEYSKNYDATPWLEYFVAAVLQAATNLTSWLTEWHRMAERFREHLTDHGLSERQTDGLIYAIRTKKLTRRDYMEITSVSGLTASRDLAGLVKRGLLEPKGNTRSRVYLLIEPEKEQDASTSRGEEQRELPLMTK